MTKKLKNKSNNISEIQLYFYIIINNNYFYIRGLSNLLLDKIKSMVAFNIRVLVFNLRIHHH